MNLGAPKDYPDVNPLDDPDPFDPTGYYARKAKHRAEMIPYLIALWIGVIIIVAITWIASLENLMTPLIFNILIFGAGLIVGWNFLPQPQFVKNQVDKIRAKFTK